MEEMKIEIDWDHYLRSGVFVKKGEAHTISVQLSKKSVDDFISLCRSDSKIEAQYRMIEIYDKVRTLFGGDDNRACQWLVQKNSVFFNNSPIEYALVKGPVSVLDFLNERLGVVDGK
jgi:hypothetical protein